MSAGYSEINVLSLGCGFAPDYYAISKYIQDNNINLTFKYCGLEKSQCWSVARPLHIQKSCYNFDLTNQFEFTNFQIIIMSKVFSTLCANKIQKIFLANLTNAIKTTMHTGAVLIFNDVNHYNMGRDEFDTAISPSFTPENMIKHFTQGYSLPSWIEIEDKSILFKTDYATYPGGNTSDELIIAPFGEVRKYVFFEYWK